MIGQSNRTSKWYGPGSLTGEKKRYGTIGVPSLVGNESRYYVEGKGRCSECRGIETRGLNENLTRFRDYEEYLINFVFEYLKSVRTEHPTLRVERAEGRLDIESSFL